MDARRRCRRRSGGGAGQTFGQALGALFSVQPNLFGNLWEQRWQGQVSIAKKSQAQSPLLFGDARLLPRRSGRASLAGVEILVSSTCVSRGTPCSKTP